MSYSRQFAEKTIVVRVNYQKSFIQCLLSFFQIAQNFDDSHKIE